MKLFRSGFSVSMLSLAAIAAGYFGGRPLLERVEFARAESTVQATHQQLETVQDLSTVFRHVGEVVEPSVVNIRVVKTVKTQGPNPAEDMLRRFFREQHQNMPPGLDNNPNNPNNPDDNSTDQSEDVEGSGVIMEVANGFGYILTNNHVAADASKLQVVLDDGRIIDNGKVLGTDPKSDLAVIQIKADRLIAANWGNSDELAKGDWILAFGSPFDYVGSMTHGIVSALNRDHVIQGTKDSFNYENFIQVDAPINPGNSGGPLVNIHGDVVGINTAIATVSGGFQGIGFAIPINQAHNIYTALKDHGSVVRGFLGVVITDVSDVKVRQPKLIKSFNYPGETGVFVPQVRDNTPATDKLQDGDIIMSLNGEKMTTSNQLRNKIADMAPGTKITLKVWRDEKEQTVEVTLGTQPDSFAVAADAGPGVAAPTKGLGMTFESLDSTTAQKFGLTGIKTGAVIASVDKDSAAEKVGLVPGMVITQIGKAFIHNAQEAVEALTKVDLKQGVRLQIATPEGRNFVFLQNGDAQ